MYRLHPYSETAPNKAIEIAPAFGLRRTSNPLRGLSAAELGRVCRTWHEASRVKVPAPGIGRAEG